MAFAFRYAALLANPWTIVVLTLISLTALPQTITDTVQHGDITILIAWFSQNHVQLVALGVLAFVADRQGREAKARDDEMYAWMSEWHAEHAAKLAAIHETVVAAAEAT